MSESKRLLDAASRVIPGGVNSPVRAFRAVGGAPPFIQRGEGARLWDADGKIGRASTSSARGGR